MTGRMAFSQLRTSSYKVRSRYPLLDILLVPQPRVRHEGPVQPRSEVVEAQRVGLAKMEQFC